MNGSDKYYFKQGKLELSMLDDEEELTSKEYTKEDDSGSSSKNSEAENNLSNLRQDLKIDQEIYQTLHAMGKFLTKKDFKPRRVEPTRQKISKEDEIKEVSQTINLSSVPLPFEECLASVKALTASDCFRKKSEAKLEQSKIDEVVNLYFNS